MQVPPSTPSTSISTSSTSSTHLCRMPPVWWGTQCDSCCCCMPACVQPACYIWCAQAQTQTRRVSHHHLQGGIRHAPGARGRHASGKAGRADGTRRQASSMPAWQSSCPAQQLSVARPAKGVCAGDALLVCSNANVVKCHLRCSEVRCRHSIHSTPTPVLVRATALLPSFFPSHFLPPVPP